MYFIEKKKYIIAPKVKNWFDNYFELLVYAC